jgi:glucose-6-phosphate isomerase
MSVELKYKETCGQSAEKIQETAARLLPYAQELQAVSESAEYDSPESAINLPGDENVFAEIETIVKNIVSPKLEHILLFGIGGSSLGAKAVYDAFPKGVPEIHFCDTVDGEYAVSLANYLKATVRDPEEILCIIVSKSGETTETIANAEYILHAIGHKLGMLDDRLVTISEKSSGLSRYSASRGGRSLFIPKMVSGRFSFFSPVGLFPIACLNLDLARALKKGAKEMRARCLEREADKNPAMLGAAIAYLNYSAGKNIHDFFVFHPELESFGKWVRQLIGESLGKEGKGIAPTVSVGSNDLHSVAQLYLGGPQNFFFTFLRAAQASPATPAVIPLAARFNDIVPYLACKSLQTVMDAIYSATTAAFRERGAPFVEISVSDLSGETLGGLMQLQMMETMYLAKLMNVNAFDQPNVEFYKSKTREILRTL